MECSSRINHYLASGGLFNPELMEHEKVSQLLQDCRTEIKALEEKLKVAIEDGYKSAINKLRELKESDISKWSHSRSLYFAPVELSDFLLIQLKNNKALELITKANAKPN